MLTRKADWVELFEELVAGRKDAPYAWGGNDCCSFACDCVLATTGTDIYAEFRGKYTDEAGSVAAMSEAGIVGKVEAVEYVVAKFEMAEVGPMFAQRGDVVLLGVDGGFALGIVALDGCNVVAVAAEGLHRVPMSHAVRAWRVG